jgi:GntR family transcriptional regulator
MHFLINPADDLPIYRQIMRQLMDGIAGGQLQSGDRLTSHRDLSEQLVIAPLTVKKAYDELEKLGYIESQRGRGTFVAARLPTTSPDAANARLKDAARLLLTQSYLAGLHFADVLRLMENANRELTDAPAPTSRKEVR